MRAVYKICVCVYGSSSVQGVLKITVVGFVVRQSGLVACWCAFLGIIV